MYRCVGAKLPLYTFNAKRKLGPNKRAYTGCDDHCVPHSSGGSDDYGNGDSQRENRFLDDLILAQVRPLLLVSKMLLQILYFLLLC